MSVRQLRSMQLLLQGLCKVHLLKCEDFATKEMKQIQWFDVDINLLGFKCGYLTFCPKFKKKLTRFLEVPSQGGSSETLFIFWTKS